MSRKLMAMMLAIGLVIGLVGGFFGGYFYNNFKAEDGGTGGGTTGDTTPQIIVDPANSYSKNKAYNTEVVEKEESRYYCPTTIDPGFGAWSQVRPEPIWLHIYHTDLIKKGKEYAVKPKVTRSISPEMEPFMIGSDRTWKIVESIDKTKKLKKLIKSYSLGRINSIGEGGHNGFYSYDENDNTGYGREFWEPLLLGKLNYEEENEIFPNTEPVAVCKRAKTNKTGGGTE